MKLKQEDIKIVQELMHYYGKDKFIDLVREAAWCAHEETETLEQRKISEEWRKFFDTMSDMSTIEF